MRALEALGMGGDPTRGLHTCFRLPFHRGRAMALQLSQVDVRGLEASAYVRVRRGAAELARAPLLRESERLHAPSLSVTLAGPQPAAAAVLEAKMQAMPQWRTSRVARTVRIAL